MSRSLLLRLALLVTMLAPRMGAQPHGTLGTVRFETSCATGARAPFVRGVAHLHSFGFPAAVQAFNEALAADSSCVIAYWGLALTAWGNPFAPGITPDAQLRRGLDAVERARTLGGGSERERAYLAAVAGLYDDYASKDQRTRVAAYRNAMAELAARHPTDDEAAIFYALVLSFSADPADKAYVQQREAAAILERVAERRPDHPGIAHYLIHSYDYPALATQGLTAADRYAMIAPSSAHALHMPSHTYTRVGSWAASIATNRRSARAAVEEGSVAEALHASDYMMYAYLQTGQDSAATRVFRGLDTLAARFDPNALSTGAPPSAGYFAIAAIPARYMLERADWACAAALPVRETPFPFTDAITWFARGIGAARSGDTVASTEAVAQLQRLRDMLAKRGEMYWSEQVEIQRRGVAAWLLHARGARAEAVAEMRAAADIEARTEKSVMTPGPILPARELLGDMLYANRDVRAALVEFERTLTTEPNRFRALAGAMSAALALNDRSLVRQYARRLVRSCRSGDHPGRPDLSLARRIASR
jgi:hypothetical protein